ncbi:hypothetical protein GCM10028772_25140 [Nocardioides ultimimeridianus]
MDRPMTRNVPVAEATWYVCASHRTSFASDTPFGVRHARHVGSRYAACGRSVFGWTMFWAERFEPGLDDVCARCSEVVIAAVRRELLAVAR